MRTIVAGSYERYLFGFDASGTLKQGEELNSTFVNAAHQGPVRCLAAAAPYLVSGGTDEVIHVYDLKASKDHGFLMSPGDGALLCMAFHVPEDTQAPSHLLSGGADGSICIWKAGGEWPLMKRIKGHKGAVNDVAVHHSGRLALTVSRDRHLRMWDLLKGKMCYTSPFGDEGHLIEFVPGGEAFACVSGMEVTLRDGQGEVMASMSGPSRVMALQALSSSCLLVGLEDGSICLWDTRTDLRNPSVALPKSHASRVKGLTLLGPDPQLRVWDLRKAAGLDTVPTPLMQSTTKARYTCLSTCQLPLRPAKPPSSEQPSSTTADAPAASPAAAPKLKKKKRPAADVAEVAKAPKKIGMAQKKERFPAQKQGPSRGPGGPEDEQGVLQAPSKKQARKTKASALLERMGMGGQDEDEDGPVDEAEDPELLVPAGLTVKEYKKRQNVLQKIVQTKKRRKKKGLRDDAD